MLVIDAAFVVAALVDGGREGTWADGLLGGEALAAPHLMPVEVANILRRVNKGPKMNAVLAREMSQDVPGTDLVPLVRRIRNSVRQEQKIPHFRQAHGRLLVLVV